MADMSTADVAAAAPASGGVDEEGSVGDARDEWKFEERFIIG